MAKITFPQVFGKPKPPRRQKPPSNSGGTPYRRASSHMNAYAPAMRGAGDSSFPGAISAPMRLSRPQAVRVQAPPAQTSFAARRRSSAVPQSPGHHPALENMFQVCRLLCGHRVPKRPCPHRQPPHANAALTGFSQLIGIYAQQIIRSKPIALRITPIKASPRFHHQRPRKQRSPSRLRPKASVPRPPNNARLRNHDHRLSRWFD